MRKVWKTILCVILIGVLTLAFGSCKNKSEERVVTGSDRFDLTNNVLEFIKDTYYEDIDYDLADVYAAYGLISSLGPYNYITPITDLLVSSSDGKGFGLIVRTTMYNEHMIDFILPGSPFLAPSNGRIVQRGDEIYAINGQRVAGLDSSTYSLLIGDISSEEPTTFSMRRGTETFDVTYTKIDYKFPECIYINDLPGVSNDFGYIYLRSFDNTSNVKTEFENAVKSFNVDANKALILDLRGNGGGSTDVLRSIASALIGNNVQEGEKLVEVKHIREDVSKYIFATKVTHKIDAPVYVLCDGRTASASEALIGIMKAHGTLTALVGKNTVGKGVAQNGFISYSSNEKGYIIDKGLDENGNVIDLNAYLLQVIIGKYYILDPSVEGGKYCIHGAPFVPDIKVTGDTVVSPDYSEDSFIRCVIEHYNSQIIS